MVTWPESLIQEIAERRVVFFIGSGLSKAAHDIFPSWPELLEKLSINISKTKDKQLIKNYVKQGRMLDAAQIINDGLPKPDLSASLRRIFQVRPIPHHDLYQYLLLMDPKTIVTTNYDEFLEKNFEHYSGGTEAHVVCKHKATHLINDLRSPVRSIVKMHGCITDPSDIVLDRLSYYEAKKENPGIYHALSSLMTVNTVLFLGYSISDPDIQLILENINLYSKATHTHYALMSKFDHSSIKVVIKKTYNVDFLEYPAGAHGSVPDIIKGLHKQVLDFRAARGII